MHFFQAAIVLVLQNGANKSYGEKLDSNYTKMLRAILNKSRRQHPRKQQLYGHLQSITKTIHELDESDMQDTVSEVRMNSLVMYSCGPLHMDEQRLDDHADTSCSLDDPWEQQRRAVREGQGYPC